MTTNKKKEKKIIYRPRSWGKKKKDAYNKGFLAGQDSVRDCVPKARELLDESNPDNYEACYAIEGFNDCRNQTLSNISKLQDKNKEI